MRAGEIFIRQICVISMLSVIMISAQVFAQAGASSVPAQEDEAAPISAQSPTMWEALTKSKAASRVEKLEAHALLAQRSQARGEDKLARAQIKRALALWSVLERDETLDALTRRRACSSAAMTVFTHAELDRRRSEPAMRAPETLQEGLKRQVDAVTKLQTSYLKVFQLGHQCQNTRWKAAAMVRTGGLYERIIKLIEDSPTPNGLAAAQEEIYLFELRAYIDPLRKKAQDSYEAAKKLDARGDAATLAWQKEAQEKLQGLNDGAR